MDIEHTLKICNDFIRDYELGDLLCLDALENNNELREMVVEFGEQMEKSEKQKRIADLKFIITILEHRLKGYKKELEVEEQ